MLLNENNFPLPGSKKKVSVNREKISENTWLTHYQLKFALPMTRGG